ncbi:hypothetical protein GOBAR_DD36334 [Gossypium barbadense]|nr:hypothetical protein GOBAR_DD36334 [Gossypium barbadense]
MKYTREGDWTSAPVPPAVADRRVKIIGPVERKMINSALNSGAIVSPDINDMSDITIGSEPLFEQDMCPEEPRDFEDD